MDAKDIQTRFTNAFPNTFGKRVEFRPYQLSEIWSKEDYMNLFHQKSKYIDDIGAVAFHGVTEWFMDQESGEEQSLQQFLLTHEKIISIEKSDTPRQGKWWVLAKKEDLEEVTKFLNTDVVSFMEKTNAIQHT